MARARPTAQVHARIYKPTEATVVLAVPLVRVEQLAKEALAIAPQAKRIAQALVRTCKLTTATVVLAVPFVRAGKLARVVNAGMFVCSAEGPTKTEVIFATPTTDIIVLERE